MDWRGKYLLTPVNNELYYNVLKKISINYSGPEVRMETTFIIHTMNPESMEALKYIIK